MSEKCIKYSDLESRRFGFRIFRGSLNEIDREEILSIIIENEVDLLIIRLPSMLLGKVSTFNNMSIPYITADTLVYYYLDLGNYTPNQLKNKDLTFTLCSSKHSFHLDQLTQVIFNNYTNHYSSNPYLDSNDILKGYQEWARNYITDLNEGCISWLVNLKEEIIGFITCYFNKNECEIILNGVLPEASGKGIYSDIIRFTQQYFKAQGFQTMKVSTQVQNMAVQKVWAREGFEIKESYNTVHFNCFMNKSIFPKIVYNLHANTVSTYLTTSFVKEAIANSVPNGFNSLTITNYSYSCLKQMDNRLNYKVEISFPLYTINSNKNRVLVKVFHEQELIIIAYYDYCINTLTNNCTS